MSKRLILLSSPVGFGKTSSLLEWTYKRTGVGGILTPDYGNSRKLLSLRDRQLYDLQIAAEDKRNFSEDETISIGRFLFIKSAFKLMNDILIEDMNAEFEYLIVDELGKLEMKGQGLSKTIYNLLEMYRDKSNTTSMIIVIRDFLLDEAVAKYELFDAEIITLREDRIFDINFGK